jgi:hypothetical protein
MSETRYKCDHAGEEVLEMTVVRFVNGYPYCQKHGAMNKVSPFGMWRCLTCHIGFDEVKKEVYSSSNEGFRKK